MWAGRLYLCSAEQLPAACVTSPSKSELGALLKLYPCAVTWSSYERRVLTGPPESVDHDSTLHNSGKFGHPCSDDIVCKEISLERFSPRSSVSVKRDSQRMSKNGSDLPAQPCPAAPLPSCNRSTVKH